MVLFHDRAAHGASLTEVFDAGIGVVPGLVLLPHARRRLLTDDALRMSALARRFAPASCLVLDDGVRVDLGPDGALPPDARVVGDQRPDHRGDGGMTTARQRRAGSSPSTGSRPRNRSTPTAVDQFLDGHEIAGRRGRRSAPSCGAARRTRRGSASGSSGCPTGIPMRRLHGTDLWYLVLELPQGSRVEYQIEIRRGDHYERFNDPLNEKRSHSPMGSSSVCFGAGYETPDWVLPDPDARPGELRELVRAQQGARPGRARDALPAGPVPADGVVPAAGRARRRRLPAVRRR